MRNPVSYVVWVTLFCVLGTNALEDICQKTTQIKISAKEDSPVGMDLTTTYTASAGSAGITFDGGEEFLKYIDVIVGKTIDFKIKKSLDDLPDGDKGASVILDIASINDNPPVFDKEEYTSTVLQIMPAKVVLDLVIDVTDQDTKMSSDSNVHVSITAGDEQKAFKLTQKDISDTMIRKIRVQLETQNVREMPEKGFYKLTLLATDRSPSGALTSEATVIIKVTPFDMLDPVFEQQNYNGDLYFEEENDVILVKEEKSETAGTAIESGYKISKLRPKAEIRAFDQDEFIKQELKYELVPSSGTSKWTELFKLDQYQNLFLVKTNDAIFEQKSISLLIKASQIDNDKKSAVALITFQIHVPAPKEIYFKQRIEILRRTQVDEKIYTVEIVENENDADITFSNDGGYLRLEKDTIYLARELPESLNTLETEINVRRKGKLAVTSSKVQLTIGVVTVKTIRKPLFARKNYNLDIWSDTVLDQTIFELRPIVSGVQYTKIIQTPDTGNFVFDEKTGKISIVKKPEISEYTFSIEATLNADVDTTQIEIRIVEPKKKPLPLFKTQRKVVQISTDLDKNENLFTLETNFPSSMTFQYSKEMDEDVSNIFTLDKNSGVVKLSGDLGKDDKDYQLFIVGTLEADKRVEESAVLIQVVKPKERSLPLFKTLTSIVQISSDHAKNTDLFTLETNYPASMTFEYSSQTDENIKAIFSLDTKSGLVKLTGDLENTDKGYTLIISGSLETEKRTEVTEVLIQVVKHKERSLPLFKTLTSIVQISSDHAKNTDLFTLETNYPASMTFEYSSQTDENVKAIFSMDTKSGLVKLTGDLENTDKVYTLIISGSLETEKRTEVTEVLIQVVKPKERSLPLFKTLTRIVQISSDHAKNTDLFTLETNYPSSMTFEYSSQTDENVKAIFSLDKKSGLVKLTGDLENTDKSYTLTISGSLETEKRTEVTEVLIQVVKPKERSLPLFKTLTRIVQISSDHAKNTDLFTLETNYPSSMTFEYSSQTDENVKAIFSLDKKSGLVKLTGDLENTDKSYTLTISGSLETEKRTEVTEITIEIVEPMVKPKPLFQNQRQIVQISSDHGKNNAVLTLETNFKPMTFEYLENDDTNLNKIFELDQSNGVIKLIGDLVKDKLSYKLDIKGISVSENRDDTTEVEIRIITPLAHPEPLFSKSHFRVDLMSDTKVGEQIFKIETQVENTKMKITSILPETAINTFSLNEDTGVISLLTVVDSQIKEFEITITGSAKSREDTTKVSLIVVESKRPFIPIFSKSIFHLDLAKRTSKDTEVFVPDLLLDEVGLQITGDDRDKFKIDESSKTVLLAQSILNNPEKKYSIDLTATSLPPSKEIKDIVKVVFHVVDVDRPLTPLFQKASYLVDVKECAQKGDLLYSLTCSKDVEKVTTEMNEEFFAVANPEFSGKVEIRLKERLNIDDRSTFILVLEAKTQEGLYDSIQVLFKVVTSEDCGLLDLDRAAHLVKVPADHKKGDLVFQIQANEKATYVVKGGDTTNFNVDKETGKITLAKELNSVYYHLDVLVESTQGSKKSVTAHLLFEVDLKRPLTTIFQRDVNHVDVPVDTAITIVFFTPPIEATPDDWSISYSATGGKDSAHFNVDSKGGVSLKQALEVDKSYELKITATVSEPEKLSDVTTVHFYGVEVKRTLTEIFTKSLYEVAVVQCSEIGATIFTVETIGGKSAILQITGGASDVFQLNDTTGEVTLSGLLVTDQRYVLEVKATQGEHQDKTKVIFQAVASEKCLLFTARDQSLEVSPSTLPGTAVLELNTTRDATFQIQGGDGFFEVNEYKVIVSKKLQDDTEYLIEITATSLTIPPIEDTISVIFHVGKCSGNGQVPSPSLFTRPVYKVQIPDNAKAGTKLSLPAMKPPGISVKYMLINQPQNAFKLSEDGELYLNTESDNLDQSLYFLQVNGVQFNVSYYFDFSEIPDIERDHQALIIVAKSQVPVFLEPSPFLKVFLPTASLSDYVINIKAQSKEGPLKFSLKEENSFFAIDGQSGTLYPKIDVTKTINRQFKFIVQASTASGLKAELEVEIIRLTKEETIVFTAEAKADFNFTRLEEQLRNATGLRVLLLSYFEKQTESTAFYYDKGTTTATFSVAAFKSEDDNTPMTHDVFKSETKEEDISQSIGEFETAPFKDPVPGETLVEYRDVYKEGDNGGLVAAVAVLSVLVALFLMAILGFFVLRKYKPSFLDKIRDKVDETDSRPKATPPFSRRVLKNVSLNGSYDKSTGGSSYDNVGFQLNESSELNRSEQALIETKLLTEEARPTTPILIHEDELSRVTADASRFQVADIGKDRLDSPPATLYSSQAPMDAAHHHPQSMETIEEAPSPLEREDKGKKEALSRVPVSTVNQLQVPETNPGDDVEPDYPAEPEAASSVSRKGVTREDSYGLAVEEETPKAEPEVPEAFNDDLIDEEDVDTGEPGGTPHVHRKHIEIHVEEDISDDEEEAMIRKMAQIPQRKSVVTFSDKTEVIP